MKKTSRTFAHHRFSLRDPGVRGREKDRCCGKNRHGKRSRQPATPPFHGRVPGVASFFKPPADSGAIDYLTRINLRQNLINFIVSPDAAPVVKTPTAPDATTGEIAAYPDLSFKRLGAEASKAIDPAIKFIWDAPFFNMGAVMSDLSMAVNIPPAEKPL